MNASKTKLQPLIEGQKQYVVPLFQRRYTWDSKNWTALWDDLLEVCEEAEPREHFFGSIVTMPTQSVPEGITKYTLIDGQQRLTTILILLAAIRDAQPSLAEEIQNTLLTNPYKSDSDTFKLLPTQVEGDRVAFLHIIKPADGQENEATNSIIPQAYRFFHKKLRSVEAPPHERLMRIVVNNLVVVSIVLDSKDDNPFLIFESLNAKAERLSQGDLIRNYFFMRMPMDKQTEVHRLHWEPMERALGDSLSEFIRHFLMKDGEIVRQNDVYLTLKARAEKRDDAQTLDYLQEVARYADYYAKLTDPSKETDAALRERLERLNRIEVTVAYPFLLNIYNEYSNARLSQNDFLRVLDALENFMLRRFVCAVPTYGLNKIFPLLFDQAQKQGDLLEGVCNVLSTKNYPRDAEFKERLMNSTLYGKGERIPKVKLILELLETSFGHKEQVAFDNLTIEHVMPQTPTEWWREHLGAQQLALYESHLHKLGNLTLTAYNSNLSNFGFPEKKAILTQSHVNLNAYFAPLEQWNGEAIHERAEVLSDKALEIWSDFAPSRPEAASSQGVTGTIPRRIEILGHAQNVTSWREVLEATLKILHELEPELLPKLADEQARFVSRDATTFRAPRQIADGFWMESHFSARDIYAACLKAIEVADLSPQDFKVDYL